MVKRMPKRSLKKTAAKKGAAKANPNRVAAVMAEVRAKFGKNSIHFACDALFLNVVRQRTGIYSLDFATGGGFPYGRYIHIYGPESVSKTFMSMLTCATIHREDPNAVVVWIDLERVFDSKRAAQVGMDLSRTILVNEESIEDNISIAEKFISVSNVKCFVFDSVAALITISELEGEVDEQTMGLGARLLNRFLRRWTAKNSPKSNKVPHSFVILINQVREKIQRGGNPNMPPKPQPTGGRGLRFFTSLALELAKGDWIRVPSKDDDNDETIAGQEVKCLVVKNNTFPPQRVGKFLLCTRPINIDGYKVHANAVDNMRDLVRYAKFYDIIESSGNWLKYEKHKWNGRMAAQVALHGDPELAERIYKETMRAIEIKLGVYKAEAEEESKAGAGGLRALARQKATRKR